MSELNGNLMDGNTSSAGLRRPWTVAVVIALLVIGLALQGSFSLQNLANHETQLRAFERSHPTSTLVTAFAVYVLLTGLSLPVATLLTLLYGWYFGFLRGLLLVSFASTAGATIAMLLSRYLLRDAVQRRYGHRLQFMNRAIERDSAYVLFMLCLVPTIPYVVINAVMGLTQISAWRFWWVSQLGMLSGTILYVYAGASVPSLRVLADEGVGAVFSVSEMIRLSVALTLVGVFPLVARWALRHWFQENLSGDLLQEIEIAE